MNEEKSSNLKKAVTSVGNAWIVTDSKSYPGRVYYFNTVTGEAVWNLSDEEIEKARLRTHMECKQSSKFTTCPEPKTDPPTETLAKNLSNQKYRFTEQQQKKSCPQPGINIFQTQQSPGTIYSEMSLNNISAFDLNSLNTQLNAFNVISTPTLYNSHVWAVPRTQQYILTPTIPVANQAQGSLNFAYNHLLKDNQVQTTRGNYFQGGSKRQRGVFQMRGNFRKGDHRNLKCPSVKKSDLRQIILLKRRLNSNSDQTQSYTSNKELEDDNYIIEEQDNLYETDTIMEQHSNIEKDDTSFKLDLTPLKKFLSYSEAKPNVWYIVVDINILLKEFQYIRLMTESDEYCKLMVPENVMTDLKDFIASTNDIPARRIFHSLSQLIEKGEADVDRNPSADYGNTITNPILKTCFGLLEENYNVILLSDDSEILKLKKIIKLHMFTINEVKSLLEEHICLSQSQQASDTHLKLSDKVQLSRDNFPKAVVPPNTTATVTKKSTGTESISEPQSPVNSLVREMVSARSTVDAAIQTETINNNNNNKEGDIHNHLNRTQDIIGEPPNSVPIETNSQREHPNPPVKRREIKLKRSISGQSPVVSSKQSNEKKSMRWRRNRNPNILACKQTSEVKTHTTDVVPVNNLKITSGPDEVLKEVSFLTNSACVGLDVQVDQAQAPNENNGTDSTSNIDVIESRGSSVICVNMRGSNFINVEESSTSGVISNSESNIDNNDKECMEDQDNSYNNDFNKDIVTYIVENESMEESLQTKREEWISRFIQIMEEVLTVILHEEPMFLNIALSPPWTLHEAVQCIRKYSSNDAVKLSTDKLSSILFNLSDDSGKINMKMTPSQYMTMYSSGVSLLRVIKDNISNCEDIQIAEYSLQKLLNDIKNPYSESEVDPLDESMNIEETNSTDDQTDGNSLDNEPGTNKKKYNLRSSLNTTRKESEISPVKTIQSTVEKSNIFSNCNLKNITRKIINTSETNTHSRDEGVNDNQYVTFTKDPDKDVASDEPSNNPNIVRKFVRCREFEERLKNTKVLEYDNLDYDRSDIDVYSHEVTSESNVTQTFETERDTVTSSVKTVDPSTLSNNMFKLMIRMCLQEVRNALNEVKSLCDRCYEELQNPRLGCEERSELIERVENAESHVVGLCMSLKSMLNRDPNAPSDNIQNALKQAGINISDIDEHLLLQYWVTVANSKKQADVFLNSIREIIAGLKSLQ